MKNLNASLKFKITKTVVTRFAPAQTGKRFGDTTLTDTITSISGF
ncbi:hypothetical protein [Hymenobacter koreensis]